MRGFYSEFGQETVNTPARGPGGARDVSVEEWCGMRMAAIATGLLVLAGTPTSAAPAAAPPAPAAAAGIAPACAAPVPPPVEARPAKPPFPQKPACLDAKGGCNGWEAYSYNDAIKAYNAQAQTFRPLAEAYVQRLNAYVKASADYAQCEVKALQQ